jgi:hypothetical protein
MRRPRRRARGPLIVLILVVLGAAGAYLGLVLYPERAAANLMRPSSAEFTHALEAYRATAGSLPLGATDPSVLLQQATTILETADEARERLSSASGSLAAREPTDLPFVSSRPPLEQAITIRDQMAAFYTAALENVGSLESVAGYVSELGGILPQLQTFDETLGGGDLSSAVASAIPIADQFNADLEALAPPDELGALHTSVLAIAQRIRADLDELSGAGNPANSPVVAALFEDVRGDVDTFRRTVGTAPEVARQAGLGLSLRGLETQAQQIIDGLRSLREDHGISGLTVPG